MRCLRSAVPRSVVVWCWAASLLCTVASRAHGAEPPGGGAGHKEFWSYAFMEVQQRWPGETVDAEREAPAVRIDMLTWGPLRELVVRNKERLGVDIDPDNRRQLAPLIRDIADRTRVEAVSYRHIRVSHHSPAPERNALIVNEMVKYFVGQHRRKAQEKSKADVRFLRERLAGVKATLREAQARGQKDTSHEAATVQEAGKALREAELKFDCLMEPEHSSRFRVIEYARDGRDPAPREAPAGAPFEPVSVRSLQKGDIIYSQLDRNGFVTSISHFFRELGPEADDPKKGFVIRRTGPKAGTVELYRLRNVGTGEVYSFKGIAVGQGADGAWRITDAGQQQIRDGLQKRMRVKIRRIAPR